MPPPRKRPLGSVLPMKRYGAATLIPSPRLLMATITASF